MNDVGIDKFRFYIIDEKDRPRSSQWFVSSYKKDVYVAPQATSGSLKLSIHRDGNCQYGTTKEYLIRARELGITKFPQLIRWKRAQSPESGGIQVASILFPTDFLRRQTVPHRSNLKFALPLAPSGQAIEVMIFFSRDKPQLIKDGLLERGITPIVYVTLPEGEHVALGARNVPFDPKLLPNFKDAAITPLAGAPQPGKRIGGVHAIFPLNTPVDGKAIHLVEINGLSVAR